MELFFTFLVTVTAGVVCHLISKWLDRHDKCNQQPSGRFATIKRKEESPDCTPLRSGDSFFAYMEFSTFLCLSALQHMQMLIARYISFSQNKNLSFSSINQDRQRQKPKQSWRQQMAWFKNFCRVMYYVPISSTPSGFTSGSYNPLTRDKDP